METVLKVENLSKIFPKVVANDNVSFDLKKGEIVAILGENGAGKSTLMNCLYGIYHPTKGDIYIKGEKVKLTKIEDAEALGIGMVHQHFMLVEDLTVAENIILGRKTGITPYLDLKKVEKAVKELSDRYNFGLNPKSKIKDLSVGTRQRVEILKMLYRNADILILDEATAVLTPQETVELFKTLKHFVDEGKSILMITHKLEEVMELADRVVVLIDGKMAGSVNRVDTNPRQLANMMVGRDVLMDFDIKPVVHDNLILQVKNLTVKNNHGLEKIKNLSFEIKQGEILGVAGVDGNGQAELAEALTGLMKIDKGEIVIGEKVFTHLKPKMIYEQGMSHIPQDRHERGLVLDMTVNENLALEGISHVPFSYNGIIDFKYIKSHGKAMIKDYNIKCYDGSCPTKELSGGNQQKVIVAREIDRKPNIIIAVQPTRGLDIGATEFVRNKLLEEKERGAAVLLISTELEEILMVSNRIAVIHEGEFMGVIDNKNVDILELGLMMTGMRGDKDEK
ncbi:MAG: ABC transporter ATP-binding protein [Firmicutes bacterium]|nr:ABC transporter ATP-binding protein [Bacillota bacterium]